MNTKRCDGVVGRFVETDPDDDDDDDD